VGIGNDYGDDCHGAVIRLPDAFASGWCVKPYPPYPEGDPDHTWTIAFQRMQIDQYGNAIPVGGWSPSFHYSNRAEDNQHLPGMMVFTLKGHHQPGGGATFYPSSPSACEMPD